MTTTIRVQDSTKERISALATATNRSMTSVVDDAVSALERQRFFDDFDRGYERLRSDDTAWEGVIDERQIESAVLSDDNE